MSDSLVLERVAGRFAVCRLEPTEAIPPWATESADLCSITRTNHELSIIAAQAVVHDDVTAERDYAAYAVLGPLDFSIVGLLAKLTTALAAANVAVLAVSTYETDILLVKAEACVAAERALEAIATLR